MCSSYILGLDIGIGSVGYGLIKSESRDIIDAGVRLFPEANVENNEGRRSKRGHRRLERRRQHRIVRVKQLLREFGLLGENIPKSTNPYEIRKKGLYDILTKEEFVIALLHLAKRRGVHNINVIDDNEKNEPNTLSTKDQLSKNAKYLKEQYICELQLERLNNKGKVRGEENRFTTNDYLKEASKLIDQQLEHLQLNQIFKEKYLKLLKIRRAYYEGPSKPSPYGWGQILRNGMKC